MLLFPKPGTTEPWLDTTFSSLLRDAAKAAGVTASSQRLRRVFSTTGRKSGVARFVLAEVLGNSERVNEAHNDDVDAEDARANRQP